MDNCEHLVEACAGLAKKLLQSAPGLKVLATSREALGVTGEVIFHVPSLSLPAPGQTISPDLLRQTEAGRLFLERARAVLPGFEIDVHNAEPVAQFVSGWTVSRWPSSWQHHAWPSWMWSRLLPAQPVLSTYLTGNSRTSLERHHTLHATIEWSYDLLSEPETHPAERLAVFVGGWTIDAAEAVCANQSMPVSHFARMRSSTCSQDLVDKSLMLTSQDQARRCGTACWR